MTTVLLVRHGRTTANATGVLAGRAKGVHLDDRGGEQAAKLGTAFAALPIDVVVTSPLERARQTATPLCKGQAGLRPMKIDKAFIECDYGDWTGRTLASLSKLALWKVVQDTPSAVTFPGGESMLAMQQRAVDSIRRWNEQLGPSAVYVVVSHGDVIKSILADALGMHLDSFQRIHVDPASVSVVNYGLRPSVLRMNDTTADLGSLVRPARRRQKSATLGGGKG